MPTVITRRGPDAVQLSACKAFVLDLFFPFHPGRNFRSIYRSPAQIPR
jgi:hypothetical protein